MFPGAPHNGQIGWIVIVGLIAISWIVRRNLRPRTLKLESLWIRPALIVLIVGASLGASPLPSDLISAALLFLALAAGIALGWQRGRFMRIDVDPQTHALSVRTSAIGMVMIIGLFAAKMAFRGASLDSHRLLGVPAATVTDALSLLLASAVVTQAVEMWLRARRLLDEARRAKAAREGSSGQPQIVS